MTAGLLSLANAPVSAPVPIGAGGFISGLSIVSDGTLIVRTDTYGGYSYNRTTSQWQQFTTATSMPSADVSISNAQGIYEVAIAPSSTAVWYKIFNGYVYRSLNRGAYWSKTTLAQDTAANANANNRGAGPRMAVDPVNANTLVVSTPTAGVSYSQDGGQTWTAIATSKIPAATGPGYGSNAYLVQPDPSTSSGGNTPGWYVHSYGNGLYHTTNLTGGTWTKITGMPSTANYMTVDSSGNVFLTDDAGNNGLGTLWKWNGSSASNVISGSGNVVASVAVDPANPTHVYALGYNGVLFYSSNTGTSFVGGSQSVSASSSDIPWIGAFYAANNYIGLGGRIAFDTVNSNTLLFSMGLGVLKCNPAQDGTTAIAWSDMSSGIEQLVSTWGISPPGYNPLFSVYDRGVFSPTPGVFPSTYWPLTAASGDLIVGWSMDYAPNNPATVVAIVNFGGLAFEGSGVSNDAGKTWTQFTTLPGGANDNSHGSIGGCICAASKTNFVAMRTDSGTNPNPPYYTTNAGATWTACSVGIVPVGGNTGWGVPYYDLQQVFAADRVDGTIYGYNAGAGRAINSGTYNSSTGAVSLTLSDSTLGAISGASISLSSLTGTGSVSSLNNNTYTCTAGTTGTTINFTAATGLGAITITGGYCAVPCQGLWKSTNSGATFTQVNTTDLGNGITPRLIAVPGNAGHLCYTQGEGNGNLMFSTNHGTNFSAVTGISAVWDFGFGAIAPAQTYPTAWVHGTVGGVQGLYRSKTGLSSPTWVLIEKWPGNRFDIPIHVTPDSNNYAVCYVGYKGSGMVREFAL